jgi:hypothetical protein
MTDAEIKAAWALVNGATEGPWEWTDPPGSLNGEFLMNRELDEGVLNHADTSWPVDPGNRRFIAESRTLIEKLLREIERMRVGVHQDDLSIATEVCHDLMNRALLVERDNDGTTPQSRMHREQEAAIRKLLRLAGYE